MAVCSKTDLPLAWRAETGKMNETPTVAPLLDKLHALGIDPETCALDKGYDNGTVYEACAEPEVLPVIALRKTPAVKREHKPPSCEHGEWRPDPNKRPPIPSAREGRVAATVALTYTTSLASASATNNLTTTKDIAPGDETLPKRLRTVVFLDNQNMYMGAREAFGWEQAIGRFGNFRPYGLGRILVRDAGRQLEQVRVYTGVPTPARDKTGNAATQRRIAAWIAEKPDKVQVFPRPLKYLPKGGREKGVDVELAIDFVRLALKDEYDVGVLASCDTDLVPALQFVADEFPEKTICTVAWQAEPGFEGNANEPLDLPGGGVVRHKLAKRDFDRIADKRNFLVAADDPAAVVGETRWEGIKRRIPS